MSIYYKQFPQLSGSNASLNGHDQFSWGNLGGLNSHNLNPNATPSVGYSLAQDFANAANNNNNNNNNCNNSSSAGSVNNNDNNSNSNNNNNGSCQQSKFQSLQSQQQQSSNNNNNNNNSFGHNPSASIVSTTNTPTLTTNSSTNTPHSPHTPTSLHYNYLSLNNHSSNNSMNFAPLTPNIAVNNNINSPNIANNDNKNNINLNRNDDNDNNKNDIDMTMTDNSNNDNKDNNNNNNGNNMNNKDNDGDNDMPALNDLNRSANNSQCPPTFSGSLFNDNNDISMYHTNPNLNMFPPYI